MQRVESLVAKDMQKRWTGDTDGWWRIIQGLVAVFYSVRLRPVIEPRSVVVMSARLLLRRCHEAEAPRPSSFPEFQVDPPP